MVAAAVGGAIVGGVLMSDGPPDADPRIGQAADRNSQISQGYLDLANQQYQDQQKLLDQFLPYYTQMIDLQTQSAKDTIDRGNQQWDLYKSSFMPLEQQMADEARNYASADRQNAAAQEAGGQVATSFQMGRDQTQRSLAAAGIDPGSAKAQAMMNASYIEEAKASAGAQNSARTNLREKGLALVDNAARFGRNMPGTTLQAAGLGTQQGSAGLGSIGALQQSSAYGAQVWGNLAGGAVNANNAAGQLGLGLSNYNLNSWGQQMQLYGDMLGAGTQMYGAYMGRKQ